MRGEDRNTFELSGVGGAHPADHPLRAIRTLTDEALPALSRDFNKLYARDGRPSDPAGAIAARIAAASVL